MLIMLRVAIALAASALILFGVSAYEHTLADECDWSGSGGEEHGGVRPIYLRCTRGSVSWRYPHGALRVVFSISPSSKNLSLGHDNLGFHACVKISGPVRVFLEAGGKLRQLYSLFDGKHEHSHRCFHSRKHMAALFVEAEDDYSLKNALVKLQYDLEPNSLKGKNPHAPDEDEECRPCSMEELARAYCQSDLVARGTVSAVQQQPDLEAAELVLRVNKILHQVAQETEEMVYPKRNVRVRVPAACDARHGVGEFVIMAKRRLGDLILVCAPRLEIWAQAVREMDTAPCVLHN